MMGTLCVQSFRHPFMVRERPESSDNQYFLMNISLVTDPNYGGPASLLHLQTGDLLREEPIVSRSIIEDTLSTLRVPSRYHYSIVEKILSDAKASAIAKVLNLWVKVYMDIYDLGHSDMKEEEGTYSDTEDDMDSNTEEEEESVFCSVCNEEIVVGSEETRIPCTHMYHRDCIVRWLQSSYCLPCRYGISQQLMKPE
ncbi:E3 ubiquitin-protein ligase arkadia-like [Rosa sericea]